MADTPETKAKKGINKLIQNVCLNEGTSVFIRKNTAGGVGFNNGTPDQTLFVRFVGSAFATRVIDMEVKAGRNEPTPLQIIRLKESHAAGNHAVVIWGDNKDEMAWLEAFLKSLPTVSYPVLKLDKIK